MPLDFLGDLRRTHRCGELRAENAGQQVVLMGWVNRRRDLGNFERLVGDREIGSCRQYDLTEWLAANPQWLSVHSKRHALSSVLAARPRTVR